MREIESILTNGLTQGYAGLEVSKVERSGISGKLSHIQFPEGTYHDEWFVPTHLGGGQELVQVGEEKFTRLYAGGTPDPEILKNMGLTTKDVSRYLKKKIAELGEKTRLFEMCLQPDEDGWVYSYVISHSDKATGLTTSLESISYGGSLVHIHAFILCPVK